MGFTVNWMLNPKAFDSNEAKVAYLKAQERGMVDGSKAKLIEAKEIEIGGVTGRDFTFTIDEKRTTRVRTLVSDKLICTLTVLGKNPDAVKSDAAKLYLDSFKPNK